VIYDVAVAFYAHSAARARLATATQSLKDAKAIEAAAEDRYHKGIGTIVETSQAHQATAQANLAAVEANGRMQDAYLSLVSAMGISPLTRIRVADVSGRKLSPSMMSPVESIIATSLSRRPDVSAPMPRRGQASPRRGRRKQSSCRKSLSRPMDPIITAA